MVSILTWLLGLFGCGKKEQTITEPAPVDIYKDLRHQIFSIDPASLGLTPSPSNNVWAVLMETGYPEAVSTLVTIGDGTVSLYFSNGGGIIGVGQHKGPRIACEEFLSLAPKYVSHA